MISMRGRDFPSPLTIFYPFGNQDLKERKAAPSAFAQKREAPGSGRPNPVMSKCIITVPSMTFAQKARKVLLANRIDCTVAKLTPEQAEKGCGWGIETECRNLENVTRVLDISDVPWRRILHREGR